MRTADFAREIRTRVELDTQGYVELSVSYELEDAYNPLKDTIRGKGVVRVLVHGGSGLKPMEDTTRDGKKDAADPYLKLFFGEEQRRTETKKDTLDPEWGEEFEFDGKGPEGGQEGLEELLAYNLELECFDDGEGFFEGDSLMGTATVELKGCMRTQVTTLRAPLSTQGVISITVSWELHEEFEEEEGTEKGCDEDEDVLEGLFGNEEAEEYDPEYDGADESKEGLKAQEALKKKHWLDGYGGKTAAAAVEKGQPKPPDMLSLSIAISILVKFCLFDLVGFFQVNSSLAGSMPDIEFPPEFSAMSRGLSSAFNLDFLTDVGEANCSLGSNHCFRIMVMMFSLLAFQLAFPAGYALAKVLQTRGLVSQRRVETLVDRSIHGNAIVMMTLHPPIAKKLVSIIDCAQYDEVRVLSGFKDIECGSGPCTAVALVFICLYTLGVPLYVYLSLRSYLSPAAKERYTGNPILARYKARIGFICGKYEAGFWYYELLEMARKTGLMAVTSFIQKGSYSQLFAKMLISGFFFVVLVRNTPFNSEKLDLLVSTGQFCSLATLFFMLMMKIGFFEQEGVDVGTMNAVLMLIMFFPLFVALYIIGSAVHEAVTPQFLYYVWPRWKACFWRSLKRLQKWASADHLVHPVLAKERAEFFRSIQGERPGGAIPTSELVALSLSEHYSFACPLCDRQYMLRKGCPCANDPVV